LPVDNWHIHAYLYWDICHTLTLHFFDLMDSVQTGPFSIDFYDVENGNNVTDFPSDRWINCQLRTGCDFHLKDGLSGYLTSNLY